MLRKSRSFSSESAGAVNLTRVQCSPVRQGRPWIPCLLESRLESQTRYGVVAEVQTWIRSEIKGRCTRDIIVLKKILAKYFVRTHLLRRVCKYRKYYDYKKCELSLFSRSELLLATCESKTIMRPLALREARRIHIVKAAS